MNEVELRLKLIKELSECITLLSDEEYPQTAEYIVGNYLWNIYLKQEEYKVKTD